MNIAIGKCSLTKSETFNYDDITGLSFQSTVLTDLKSGNRTSSLEVTDARDKTCIIVTSDEYAACITNLQVLISTIMPSELDDGVSYYYTTKGGLRFGVEVNQGFFKECWSFYIQTSEDKPKIFLDKKNVNSLMGVFVHVFKETRK